MWQTVPGIVGWLEKMGEQFSAWDEQYGKDNWRLRWRWKEYLIDFLGACALCEDAYFDFLRSHPHVVEKLVREASQVYVGDFGDVGAGFDYKVRAGFPRYFDDIIIRRCLLRLGTWFAGEHALQVTGNGGEYDSSRVLSSKQMQFHQFDDIVVPDLEGPWRKWSVEHYFWANCVLQWRLPGPKAQVTALGALLASTCDLPAGLAETLVPVHEETYLVRLGKGE